MVPVCSHPHSRPAHPSSHLDEQQCWSPRQGPESHRHLPILSHLHLHCCHILFRFYSQSLLTCFPHPLLWSISRKVTRGNTEVRHSSLSGVLTGTKSPVTAPAFPSPALLFPPTVPTVLFPLIPCLMHTDLLISSKPPG